MYLYGVINLQWEITLLYETCSLYVLQWKNH